MQKKKKTPLFNFLGGTGIGIFISLIMGIVLLYKGVGQTPEPGPVLEPIISGQDVMIIETSTPGPITTQATLLEQAEAAMEAGQPEKVTEVLSPTIKYWKSNDDLIHGYKLLADAELAQGHSQLAVPYYEKLYFYQPTAENLFRLATIYDLSGDIRNALVKYQELVKWENLPPEIDVQRINKRIQEINNSLGTTVPTLTLSPE